MENYPPTLKEMLDDAWIFPVDFPVVDNTRSPDSLLTLKEVIAHAVVEKYKYHHVFTTDETRFEDSLKSYLYRIMLQQQYWIDEYLQLIEDGQFFYNDEFNEGGYTTARTGARTASSASSGDVKKSDTPQNQVNDIDNYLTSAEQVAGTDSGNESSTDTTTHTTDLHVRKSSLGDITVQFRNFANFPQFIDNIITEVQPCFLTFYNDDVELD